MIVPKKLIFLSLIRIDDLNDRGIYHDLLREFVKYGYDVTIICPVERRTKLKTRLIKSSNLTILQVKTLNIQKCNILEKGLSTLSLNFVFKNAIKFFLNGINFDLILYTTPPITLINLISGLKSKNKAKTYLLLKDIFPQNAVDMGYFKQGGILHKYFSKTEKQLYEISDRIGCMSPANVAYLNEHFPVFSDKLEVNPNCVDLKRIPVIKETKEQIRLKWKIPKEAIVFLYGGNLGKPQGVEILLQIINTSLLNATEAYFLIIGDGTDFNKLKDWFNANKPKNAQLISKLPKSDFDILTSCSDVGLILLRKEFTIPNFPSRLLSYLENKLPVFAITDTVSDIGKIAENNSFGKWVHYGDLSGIMNGIDFFIKNPRLRATFGINGFEYLKKNYNTEISFEMINKFLIGHDVIK